jgi:hypothetical protein
VLEHDEPRGTSFVELKEQSLEKNLGQRKKGNKMKNTTALKN